MHCSDAGDGEAKTTKEGEGKEGNIQFRPFFKFCNVTMYTYGSRYKIKDPELR